VVDVALGLAGGADSFLVSGVDRLTTAQAYAAEELLRELARRGATVVLVERAASGAEAPTSRANGVLTGTAPGPFDSAVRTDHE
jgi:hypothetical protein